MNKRIINIALFFFVLNGLLACSSSLKFYEVSENYNNKKYQKVSVLITRMGHFYPGMLDRISDQTDYAIRIPKYEYDPHSAKFTDVYIESEDRIRASLPEYPYYRQMHGHTSAYYGNITVPIKNTVLDFFKNRGKEVYDVQAQAMMWEPKVSELTISDIIKRSHGVSDILVVLHYMDVGQYKVKGGGINSEIKGRFLNHLYNSIAVFDLDTGERILFRDGGLVSRISVIDRMVRDEQLMNNPKYKNRIKYEKSKHASGAFIQISENFSTDLSPDEIIDIAMIYLQKDLNKIIP